MTIDNEATSDAMRREPRADDRQPKRPEHASGHGDGQAGRLADVLPAPAGRGITSGASSRPAQRRWPGNQGGMHTRCQRRCARCEREDEDRTTYAQQLSTEFPGIQAPHNRVGGHGRRRIRRARRRRVEWQVLRQASRRRRTMQEAAVAAASRGGVVATQGTAAQELEHASKAMSHQRLAAHFATFRERLFLLSGKDVGQRNLASVSATKSGSSADSVRQAWRNGRWRRRFRGIWATARRRLRLVDHAVERGFVNRTEMAAMRAWTGHRRALRQPRVRGVQQNLYPPNDFKPFNFVLDVQAKCPICRTKIKLITCWFYGCIWNFEGVQSGNGLSINSPWKKARGEKYHRFDSDDKKGSVSWNSLLISTGTLGDAACARLVPKKQIVTSEAERFHDFDRAPTQRHGGAIVSTRLASTNGNLGTTVKDALANSPLCCSSRDNEKLE
ncbi:hypothetical protein DFJ73DRAFT_966157 [Zopfochytrium polystomum]|nr:hypothetical protein DFJ73DRAFT_966157 [Zopfochytrium polystomum]